MCVVWRLHSFLRSTRCVRVEYCRGSSEVIRKGCELMNNESCFELMNNESCFELTGEQNREKGGGSYSLSQLRLDRGSLTYVLAKKDALRYDFSGDTSKL